ncbi:MAG: hypothetical protein HN348_32575 [Proteobacteria bacterium]|nr:hypothetical protein [Pseudomonadota bacterium]
MRLLAPFLLILLSSCVIGQNKHPRPRDLSPGWLVDRPRVLAIQAEPPEVQPGEQAAFHALVAGALEDQTSTIIWLACPPTTAGGIGFGCDLDLADVDLETATIEELLELGFIGFEPYLMPYYTPNQDLLDGLEEGREKNEGLHVLIQVSVLPEDMEASAELDFNEVEVAYKRLVVSESTTPNENPGIATFTVDGVPIPEGAVVEVDTFQNYELSLILRDDAAPEYEYIDHEGNVEIRQEEPYISWFSTGGTVNEEYTLIPHFGSTWESPGDAGESGTWWAVLRDRRGGMSWASRDWRVRD